jgi:Bifunctional DNA primase/polymerase, N-terminal
MTAPQWSEADKLREIFAKQGGFREQATSAPASPIPRPAVPRAARLAAEPSVNDSGLPGLPRQPFQPGVNLELQAAYNYAEQGLPPIPIKRGTKKAAIDNWQNRNLPLEEFPQYWGGNTPCGLALPLGGRSKGLIDIDLDWPEARALADELDFIYGRLLAFGRKGSLRAHRLAFCKEALELDQCRTLAFAIPGNIAKKLGLTEEEHAANVLELRGNNSYTIFPPSIHTSGERIEWDDVIGRSVPEIPYQELREQAGWLAFLAFMVRFYPPVGVRNDFNLALGGALLRALHSSYRQDEQLLIDHVDRMATLVGRLAGDQGHGTSWEKRAATTFAKIKGGAPVTGLPKLLEIIGVPELEKTLRNWLSVDADDRPRIIYSEPDLPAVLSKTQEAMLAAGLDVFQRGGSLVLCYRYNDEFDDGVNRPRDALVIAEMNKHIMRRDMLKAAVFLRVDGRTKKRIPAAPPLDFAETFLHSGDMWKFRPLGGVQECPMLRSDGTVLLSQGYDAQSRLYVDFNGQKFPTIPDFPTRADAIAALQVILKVFRGFPFDGNQDGTIACPSRSVAIAFVLTTFVRRILPTAPFFGITAPTAGSGKTKIVAIVSIIAIGKPVPLTSWSGEREENDKRIASILLHGDSFGAFDNVGDGASVGGDALCAVLTAAEYSPRILGSNRKPTLPTNVTWSFTGNNISYRDGLERRGLEIRLDANIENPEERRFDFDAEQESVANRANLVAAALTILRAFYVSPDRKSVIDSLTPFGSFNEWSELVRAAIAWLGEPDPCDSRKNIKAEDPATGNLKMLVTALVQCPALDLANWYSPEQICVAAGNLENVGLASALKLVMPKVVTPMGLGRYLSKFKDRVVDGYRIRKRLNPSTRAAEYLLELVANSTVPAMELQESPFEMAS